MPPDDRPSDRPERHGSTPPLEWALAAASGAVVLAVVAFLLYEGLGERPTPPDVRVTVESVRPAGPGYLVEFTAENVGQTTAARVEVEGVLRDGARAAETSSATLDYAPPESKRRGGLYFTRDPGEFDLEVRATGFDRP